jgi:hypothetical protein
MKKIVILFVPLIVLTNVLKLAAQSVKADAAINQVILEYFTVESALSADNSRLTQVAARSLYKAVRAVPAGELGADQRKLWETYTVKLQTDSKHINESAAIGQQREYFAALSQNLFQVVKMLKANDKPIYQEYCPMKNATWLSENKEIKNPYYGMQMSSCGKVIQTLNPAPK